jgi:glycosyltransferase involved in cell wall biosynthesis
MKVLVAHNRYRSDQPSGENTVVDAEIDVLRRAGLEVVAFLRSSDEIASMGALSRLDVAMGPVRSRSGVAEFRQLLEEHHPDVVHVHNVYPLLSPWIIREAKAHGVPVVMTIHNFRLDCVAGTYLRDGQICTDCAGHSVALPALRHGCYRGSRLQSVPMVMGRSIHRSTWMHVDRFLVFSPFHRAFMERLGVAQDRIVVRPTSTPDPGDVAPLGTDIVFVGRLSEQKGIRVLLDAWRLSQASQSRRLHIVGDGELRPLVEKSARGDESIVVHGSLTSGDTAAVLRAGGPVVIPSLGFEGGLTLVFTEALSHGRPVIASDIGGLGSAVDDEIGWRVLAHEPAVLAATFDGLTHDDLVVRGAAARQRYVDTYSPAVTTPILLTTYQQLLEPAGDGPSALSGPHEDPA